jgi:hypothetical protein
MLESFSIGNWGWIIFYLVLTSVFSQRLLIWLLGSRKKSSLLLKVETTYGKSLRNLGLLYAVVSLLMLAEVLGGHYETTGKLVENISRFVFISSNSLYFVVAGNNYLEFRSQGIYSMLAFFPWQNIKSYSWQQPKPETIRLRVNLRRYGFFSILAVPIADIEAIEQILHERISRV